METELEGHAGRRSWAVYEALRVAFIDEVETLKDGRVHKEFYSKLVKADINGKDKEIYSIKLPGNPKLGEGKPENQNHAIVFTRGNAIQTVDMNQALSGVESKLMDRALVTKNTALTAALNTHFLIHIGIFTAVPMILGFILEQGFLRVITLF
ncbi:hypothetical protein ACFX13_028766 [Malus domestica]